MTQAKMEYSGVLVVGEFSIQKIEGALLPFNLFRREKFIGEFISIEAAEEFIKDTPNKKVRS